MKPPELSIIMPVYNSVKYVAEAVNSLLSQSFTNFELIIVNDASTDGSADVLTNFNDGRIKLFNNHQNRGIVYSRNRGLAEARGKFIAQFDSDDIAMPDKFEKQIDFLKKNPGFGMVGSWVRMIDGEGKLMKEKWRLPAKPELIPAIMLFRNYFVQSTVVARVDAIPEGGYKAAFDVGEDYVMWIEIAKKHKVWNLPEYLINYRVHGMSTMNYDTNRVKNREQLIFKNLLGELKIDLAYNNVETHEMIKENDPIDKIETLKRIEGHLNLIILQNRITKVYDEKALSKVVLNRWLKCCYRARAAGFKTAGIFLSSPLTLKFIGH
jgi:glycosyltransferase involved in cell wall biosynthesis